MTNGNTTKLDVDFRKPDSYEYTVRMKEFPQGQEPDNGFTGIEFTPGVYFQYQEEGGENMPGKIRSILGVAAGNMALFGAIQNGKTLEIKVSSK